MIHIAGLIACIASACIALINSNTHSALGWIAASLFSLSLIIKEK